MSLDGVLEPGTLIDGRFRIERLLGQGGYGQVYQAFQLSMGRAVAVKTLHTSVAADPSSVDRFQNEARIACQLKHPNTVTYYDFGFDAERQLIYLVMEYLHGESLAQRLKHAGPLSLDELTVVLEQVCGSLSEAHSLGVIHRDIKPENIMLIERAGRPNYVKVIDFGIAKAIESVSEYQSNNLTATGALLGSPHYMAPEQIRTGEFPVDRRADIYALGCLIFKALTGVPPFRGRSAMDIATRHLIDPPPRLSTVASDRQFPRELEDFVVAALSKRPSERPTTALVFFESYIEAVGNLLVTPPHLLASGLHATPAPRPAKPTVIGELLAVEEEGAPVDVSAARAKSRRVQAAQQSDQEDIHTAWIPPRPASPPSRGKRLVLLGLVVLAAVGLGGGVVALTVGADAGDEDAEPATLAVARESAEPEAHRPGDKPRPEVVEPAEAPVPTDVPAIEPRTRRRRPEPGTRTPPPAEVAPKEASPTAVPTPQPPVEVTPVPAAQPRPKIAEGPLSVSIVVQPWGRIVVDGKGADSRLAVDLPPGRHRVTIEQFGKVVHQQSIEVAPGRTAFTIKIPAAKP